MEYITGIHALNLPCRLQTSGDWHTSALHWKNITLRNTDSSIFGDYGLEYNREIPEHSEKFTVANHLRALLDLIEEEKFSLAQGAKNDFICNKKYHREFFNKIWLLRNTDKWIGIDRFMYREFGREWKIWKNDINSTNT